MINEDKIKAMNLAIQYYGLERYCKENVTYKIVEETADSIYSWLTKGNSINEASLHSPKPLFCKGDLVVIKPIEELNTVDVKDTAVALDDETKARIAGRQFSINDIILSPYGTYIYEICQWGHCHFSVPEWYLLPYSGAEGVSVRELTAKEGTIVGPTFLNGVSVSPFNRDDNSEMNGRVLEWMPKFINFASIHNYKAFYSMEEMVIDFSKESKEPIPSFRQFRDSIVLCCKNFDFDYQIMMIEGIPHFKITPILNNSI